MTGEQDALERVNALGASTWTGNAYRHTAPNRDPLSGEGALRFGGRWNPPNLVSTIYLASTPTTCIAEFLRMAEGQGLGPESFLPRDIHEISLRELEVLDISTEANLAAVGLTSKEIASDDRSDCQEIGKLAHYLGLQGIVAPSATGNGLTIAVFEPTVRPSQLKLLSTRQMSSYL